MSYVIFFYSPYIKCDNITFSLVNIVCDANDNVMRKKYSAILVGDSEIPLTSYIFVR